jgi:hypothetical protein
LIDVPVRGSITPLDEGEETNLLPRHRGDHRVVRGCPVGYHDALNGLDGVFVVEFL